MRTKNLSKHQNFTFAASKWFKTTLFISAALMITGCSAVNAKSDPSVLKNAKSSDQEIEVHVLDVGQGLGIVAISGDDVLMYDGGDRDYSSYVVSWLRKNGISEIDQMIVSHYDADHLNGLVGALNTMTTDVVYAPDYACDTRVCNSFHNEIVEQNIELIHPKPKDTFEFKEATVTFLSPQNHSYSENNDYSLAIRIELGDSSLLISGDAEYDSEQEMVSTFGNKLKSDVYVAGHHGSSSSSSAAFLDAVDPESVIISCGKDNSYGHPHMETVKTFEDRNLDIYRTDQQGEITFTMTEDTITFKEQTAPDPYALGSKSIYQNQSGNTSQSTGNHHQEHQQDHHDEVHHNQTTNNSQPAATDYILNTNSHKIHVPNCKSVSKMKEKNKQAVNDSIESLKNQGYSPCQNCLKGY